MNISPAVTQNNTVPYVPMNKWVKACDGLDHQYTPEMNLLQMDAHKFISRGEKCFNPVAYFRWNKRQMANKHCSPSGIVLCLSS